MTGAMFALFLALATAGQALISVAEKTGAFTVIPVGSSLHLNSPGAGPNSWLSPSGRFAFGFYPAGGHNFSIGIIMYVSPVEDPVVIWTAAVDQGIKLVSKEAVLSFTGQGVLLKPSNEAKTITVIEFNGAESTGAAMLDGGNFVFYDSKPSTLTKNCSSVSVPVGRGVQGNSCITWQSFDHPTDTMMGGQLLNCGSQLTSGHSNADHSYYFLAMQCDYNLVLYAVTPKITANGSTTEEANPIWSSQTYQLGGFTKFLLGEDGHLFLSAPDGANQLDLSHYNTIDSEAKMLHRATLAPDKYFRLFSLNLVTNKTTKVYEIPTGNVACQGEFFCGVNSYCEVVSNSAECQCLPGFNHTDFNNKTKGCRRSTAELNCWPPGSSDNGDFSMEPVENLMWFDEAYSMADADSKEDCSSACLTDCNCEAALFYNNNKNCAKHKLPMSRATKGSFSTAYIKIAGEGGGGNAEENRRWEKYLAAVLLYGAIDAGVLLALLVAGIGSYWFFYGRYRLRWRKWELAFQEEVAPQSFPFREIIKATNSFAVELGRGGHASVFKGFLTMYGRPNPVPVAVKRISAEDGKGEADFEAEIRIIGRAHHANLIRLLGFCYENSKRLLIYEYMSRGSLADLIFKSGRPSWEQQATILFGVARGINYLHRDCETIIIHRDIKPENILIAENWRVKISDFGISELLGEGFPATWTKRTSAPGTPGYVAPECIESKGQNVTEKADVYSFGIVVLETVFWKRNTGDNNLFESARKYCQDVEEKRSKKTELADVELDKETMLKLGMLCVQEQPDARPAMEDVILSMLKWLLVAASPPAIVTPKIISSEKKLRWAPTGK